MAKHLSSTPELLTQSASLIAASRAMIAHSRHEMAASKNGLYFTRQCLDSSRHAVQRAGGNGRPEVDWPAEVPPLIILL